ncbi:MAG: toxin-antitoxin system HicB family antitoxin [Planctomycetota bacterium]
MRVENGVQSDGEVRQRVYQAAHRLASSKPAPDWVTFFRKILGINGVVRRTYPTPEALAEFERSETHCEILEMLTRLRERTPGPEELQEPTRVITVRLPRSLHEALRTEADEHHTSMNKLCISKLLQFIENDLIPKEQWRRDASPTREGALHEEKPVEELAGTEE